MATPVHLNIPNLFTQAGLDPATATAVELQIWRESPGCGGAYGSTPFRLFDVVVEDRLIDVHATLTFASATQYSFDPGACTNTIQEAGTDDQRLALPVTVAASTGAIQSSFTVARADARTVTFDAEMTPPPPPAANCKVHARAVVQLEMDARQAGVLTNTVAPAWASLGIFLLQASGGYSYYWNSPTPQNPTGTLNIGAGLTTIEVSINIDHRAGSGSGRALTIAFTPAP